MAIEDDDIRDRENWTAVSRHWYSKASDKAPTTGRLYHHLAILARPNALQQLFYYTKSLCVPIPFASARESIMTLFEPILQVSLIVAGSVALLPHGLVLTPLKAPSTQNTRLAPIDAAFVKVNGILFSGRLLDQFDSTVGEFTSKLDSHIDRMARKWVETG